ncbi:MULTISPECIES: GNAT family N-acetyltransferase [Streptomycetaceae]|uniref:Putative acetyltransferase n=1 Tax=Streptantibioticus cattleyicolor (strain ATCC 35852 / DSM 46488 / JCM 4925 / NBRC 14057 / NRRL 8057) TaxID=1003195 RepID=F8JQZ9_STREN|nr:MULTISPECIES: GNAT family N-acetyltransferase [Streptomycetaceae]AEW94082.1 putative acetyltransferase [Streptantibioticus cattleyicolor NRRL 8057 = DSM 46488]MYS58753.1 GNAT family N-acetyltransferase [Streptomyces sp. SID5468]CCB74437.1 putative acetyltransferase [Streptantibioticus cattleyicolor NRRL 8057 = DSM 46488]
MKELTLRHHNRDSAAQIRDLLLDIHDECYADSTDEFDQRERFAWFVDHWSSSPGFSCVIGYEGEQAVGYAYGAAAPESREWWRGTKYQPHNGHRATYHLSELMVRPKWRKTGAAQSIHEALFAERPEHLAALLVDTEHPKVQALYEGWGYRKVGEDRPFADAPLFAVMVRELYRERAQSA